MHKRFGLMGGPLSGKEIEDNNSLARLLLEKVSLANSLVDLAEIKKEANRLDENRRIVVDNSLARRFQELLQVEVNKLSGSPSK